MSAGEKLDLEFAIENLSARLDAVEAERDAAVRERDEARASARDANLEVGNQMAIRDEARAEQLSLQHIREAAERVVQSLPE